jgi:hypothetical protein
MEQEAKKTVFYKRNVPYTVGVRFYMQDAQGAVLNNLQPWIAVPVEGLRDFKMANKRALMEGLIVETSEPNVDWDTPNAIQDDDIDVLLKNYLKLKSSLAEVNSPSILAKMLERAKDQNKSGKIVALIEERLAELETDEGAISPREMQGVS